MNTKQSNALFKYLGAVVTTIVIATATVFVYDKAQLPAAGRYAYNSSPKFGGASFPPFGFVLGKESQLQVEKLIKKYNLVGASVSLTDFEKNQRPLLWWVVNSNYPQFEVAYDRLQEDRKKNQSKPLAIFGSAENLNSIIAKMLDGQHVCNSANETFLAVSMTPEEMKSVDRVCYAVIPPYGGSMIGYLSVFIPHNLTEEQLADIRAGMIEVQLDIFNRDVRHIEVANGLSIKDLDLQKEQSPLKTL